MEAKEYIEIVKNKKRIVLATIAIAFVFSFVYFYLRPTSFDVSMTLNITRSGSQETQEYKYDDFYRLQADEKFAETVVQWIKDPRIVTDIFNVASISTETMSLRQLRKSFSAEKLSPQVVATSFSASDKKTSEKIANSIAEVVARATHKLNEDQKESTWFEVVAQEPVIVRYQPNFMLILIGSFLAGIFIGFWAALAAHYLE